MHIVFQKENIKTLSKSFDLDETLRDEIVVIEDNFSLGPLKDIYTSEGIINRKEWWKKVLDKADLQTLDEKDETEVLKKIKENLNEDDKSAWIWVAPNSRDVSGYYWLVSQLQEYVGKVYVLSLNNLPFINEKGHIFYPENLHEIAPREFIKAKKLARPITLSEFEIDPDEWVKIGSENKGIRILEGAKKLRQEDYDFFDGELKKYITGDWQKGFKIIQHFLSKTKNPPDEFYLLWRLKTFIENDIFDVQGKLENSKDFEMKMKVN
ncbi:MAG: DUF1835 domain-containing protein [Ginsengibacter sp.]